MLLFKIFLALSEILKKKSCSVIIKKSDCITLNNVLIYL